MPLTENEIEFRRQGIGSSDARMIVEGHWEDLFKTKALGENLVFDKQTRRAMECGDALEPVGLRWISEDKQMKLIFPETMLVKMHNGVPAISNVDGALEDEDGGWFGVEMKAHGGYKDIDDLVNDYYPQLQHHMLVHGKENWILAVVFGQFWGFAYEVITRDDGFLKAYQAQCRDFWDAVESGFPPLDEDMKTQAWTPSPDKTCYDASKSNMWVSSAQDFIDNQEAATTFETAKKELKKLVPDDADYMFGGGLQMKRAKNGNILIREQVDGDRETAASYKNQKTLGSEGIDD